jgi:myo-inositol-hexaphosphate 3-phosphohydrolase
LASNCNGYHASASYTLRDGLFVAQVGDNLPQTRNFKLVNRADVVAALGL